MIEQKSIIVATILLWFLALSQPTTRSSRQMRRELMWHCLVNRSSALI